MTTSQSTIDFLLDQLSSLPHVRARKMFGEYALYCDDQVVGLVCDNELFVKITPPGRALLGERYVEGKAYPGAKPSMLIGADEIEDAERLCALIRLTADALRAPKPEKPKRPKKPRRPKMPKAPKVPKVPKKPRKSKMPKEPRKPKRPNVRKTLKAARPRAAGSRPRR